MRPQPGFAAINYSAYGLRAGAFTRDLPTAFRGRDGVRSAMDDYSGPRVMVLTDLELWADGGQAQAAFGLTG